MRLLKPTLLYLDEHLLVVDKPAWVLSVRGRSAEPSVADLLQGHEPIPKEEPFHTVHRLDREASGVIVFARTGEAQRRLTVEFGARRVDKRYIALVLGFVAGDGEVDLPLRVSDDGMRTYVARRGGKESVTHYSILERVSGHTLLECRPLTGRLHQIRVHLSAIGHPLAVDPLYGGGEAIYLGQFKPGYKPSRRHEERPLIDRVSLHAAQITFEHPAGTGPVTFVSPLPKDLRAALTQLRKLHR